MADKPEITARRTLSKSRIFHVEEIDLRFANGETRCFERLQGSREGSVLVVPMPSPDTVMLVREYAAGTDRYELGFPKGLIEAGEDPLQAANREIQEEIGYAARELELLQSVTIAPGYLGHTTHIVLARELYLSSLPGDEPEPLEALSWPLADLPGLLAREDFTEARSIAALYLARDQVTRLP